jgi:hypothetical protein
VACVQQAIGAALMDWHSVVVLIVVAWVGAGLVVGLVLGAMMRVGGAD